MARGALVVHMAGPLDADEWWRAIRKGPFSAPPEDDLAERPLVLACVSMTYAPFFACELERVPIENLRIFGAGIERKMPPRLRPAILPYDERLEGRMPGTRSDFAQRAMLHYASTIGIASRGLEDDRAFVERTMSDLPPPRELGPGRRLDDDAIRALIVDLLPTIGRRRTAMLQYLRKERGIACEQARFATLFASVVSA